MTEELPHPGQRTPSGQRCWRTKAKHFASSIRPERLTKSDAGMMAEAPRASRLAARTPAITSDTRQRNHPDHHPGTRQEPYEKGTKVSDAEIASLNITPADFHGEWNYTIAPRQPDI
jgi:hypothetical protein